MSKDEFTKLFMYMSQRFDAIEKTLASKADKADIERLFGLFDVHEKRIETLEQEKQITDHQLNHYGRQINKLTNYIGNSRPNQA